MYVNGPSHLHGAQPLSGPHQAQAYKPTAPASTPLGGDQVEFSEAANLAAKIAELPDVRADRVASIRAAIADGTYETDEKLGIALDRFLDEVG